MHQIDTALSDAILHYRIEEKLGLIQLEEAILKTIDSWKTTPEHIDYHNLDDVLSSLKLNA